MSPIYQSRWSLLRYIPAPETPFDVRSHFCPMKLFFSLFTVEVYALFGRKSQVRFIGSLEGLESFQEYAHRNNLVPDTNVIVFEHVPCTDSISHQTGFKAGEELIHIVRIRKLDGSSRQIDNDYLLASAVGNLNHC